MRIEKDADFVKLPWTVTGAFKGRYAVQKGRKVFPARWQREQLEALRELQAETPVELLRDRKRTLWHFHDRFWWDDDGLSADDLKALVLRRERSEKQKLQTAHSLMRAEENGTPSRTPIAEDLRRAVFERDGGKCVECESSFDLQYDHILPVARGGATTFENLQLLCADCNRRKSDSL